MGGLYGFENPLKIPAKVAGTVPREGLEIFHCSASRDKNVAFCVARFAVKYVTFGIFQSKLVGNPAYPLPSGCVDFRVVIL